MDCRTWRWYSMLFTDESLPMGAAAAATGRLASFAPSTLAPVFPVVGDIIVLGVDILVGFSALRNGRCGRTVSLMGVSVDAAVDGLWWAFLFRLQSGTREL